jgi:hypothetical protein
MLSRLIQARTRGTPSILLQYLGPDLHPGQQRKSSTKRILDYTFCCAEPMIMTKLFVDHSNGLGTWGEESHAP